ncbi:hypothetical protein SeMB42_g05176 [Synchytrium endobioticum]|uniref:F-box domain-containing protein n=1 Tax=Synchytrium endobioticum TaxID=286115 RepID=A0A507CT33_9FUNG|nr:hypothetical protein SeMB42_g05176 [Synchytrium endobioticum]
MEEVFQMMDDGRLKKCTDECQKLTGEQPMDLSELPLPLLAACTNLQSLALGWCNPHIVRRLPSSIQTLLFASIDEWTQQDYRDLVAQCPSIRELALEGVVPMRLDGLRVVAAELTLAKFALQLSQNEMPEVDFGLLEVLASRSGDSLTHLHLSGLRLASRGVPLNTDGPMFPSLVELHLTDVEFEDSSVFAALVRGCRRLQTFRREGAATETILPTHFHTLIRNNAQTLEVLQVLTPGSVYQAGSFTHPFPSLRKLACSTVDALQGNLNAFIAQNGSQLERVELYDSQTDPPCIDLALVGAKCPNLVKLVLDISLTLTEIEMLVVSCKKVRKFSCFVNGHITEDLVGPIMAKRGAVTHENLLVQSAGADEGFQMHMGPVKWTHEQTDGQN